VTIHLQERRARTAPVAGECMWCFGSGRVPNDDQQQYDPCEMCQGSDSCQVAGCKARR
jgi:hypothetical protein